MYLYIFSRVNSDKYNSSGTSGASTVSNKYGLSGITSASAVSIFSIPSFFSAEIIKISFHCAICDISATIGNNSNFGTASTLFKATKIFALSFIFSTNARIVSVIPFCTSSNNSTASASDTASIAAATIARSNRREGLKTPGVSTKINCRVPTIFTARNLVRVVCTLCETIDTLRPII